MGLINIFNNIYEILKYIMNDLEDINIEITLKSVDYNVNVNVIDNERFVLEVQSIQTAELWKGCFESKYIEDLTKKTGNFKSFQIFLNMFYAALKGESSTVNLDILTYNDLEMLREKNSSSHSFNKQANSKNNNNNKRYLILTYNVEFDRINYPLQLNYQGIPDPIALMKTIRKLDSEIKAY